MTRRSVGVVTVGRSDYGIYFPVLQRLTEEPSLQPMLFVSGAHLAPQFGRGIDGIEADGWPIVERVHMLLASDEPEGIAASIGIGTTGFAHAFARSRPEILLVLGDRFEMLAAVAAAIPFGIPIAHIHGGELTAGAIDEQIRHAITKMSHLHFVATAAAGARVVQMGEEPWRVTVCGAPGLDNVRTTSLRPWDEVRTKLGIMSGQRPLLATFHPLTVLPQQTTAHVNELLAALASFDDPVVITAPNADAGHSQVRDTLRSFCAQRADAVFVETLGTGLYFSLLACAVAMVGNSSSGILEAASFRLPVVNVGARQDGRERAANVIDVVAERDAIRTGILRAKSPRFVAGLEGLQNPYGDGRAAERIVNVLRDAVLDERLIVKRFHTMPRHDVHPAAVEDVRVV
jgi:UDP-hydrolysing UDP-N-acetyl-D-glucosamine 2-epimerase